MSLDMNPDVRAAWCAALRSGEYKQGREELRRGDEYYGDEYCCLGMLTDLYVKSGQPENFQGDDGTDSVWDDGLLNPRVSMWAGLKELNPWLARSVTAVGANDDKRWDFARIADAIDGGKR